MGAIKITPDNVAPGNGPKYNVITIGASNGAQGLKAAVKKPPIDYSLVQRGYCR